jgi:hypothetical protein
VFIKRGKPVHLLFMQTNRVGWKLMSCHSFDHYFKMRPHDRIYDPFIFIRCDTAYIRVCIYIFNNVYYFLKYLSHYVYKINYIIFFMQFGCQLIYYQRPLKLSYNLMVFDGILNESQFISLMMYL